MSERKRDDLTLYPLADYAAPVGFAIACLEKERERTKQVTAELSVQDLDAYSKGFTVL